MNLFKHRQNKKTLGLKKLKGVTIINIPFKNKFNIKFKAEVRYNANHFYGGIANTSKKAAKLANSMFLKLYQSKRAAKKAGYWNEI